MPMSAGTKRLCNFMVDTSCVCHARWMSFLRGSHHWTTHVDASVWRIVDCRKARSASGLPDELCPSSEEPAVPALYIDAFAGTGDRTSKRREVSTLLEVPDLDNMTKGSARVALEIDPPFNRYIFIEKRTSRASALEQLKSEYAAQNIEILNEDANTAVQRICANTNWRNNRAVLFLDPYGMQVSWETLAAVAATKAIDLWMLYPTGMGLNRLLTKDGEIPPEWQQILDRSLGCTDWRDAFYRVRTTPNLFGDPMTELVKDANSEKFEAFLLDRLRTIFAGVCAKSLSLRNSKGQVMYLLCFAIGNPRGVQLAMRIANAVIKGRRR
jgi:three-Cys-motif partner protein